MGTARYGFDTTYVSKSTASAATSTFGTPDFWCRYLEPSAYPMTTSSAITECRRIWDHTKSTHGILFVTAPRQSRLSGSKAMGTSDATTFCASFKAIHDKVPALRFPKGGSVYVYLDVEYGTNLSTAYWKGWAGYVNNYDGIKGVTRPLHAGVYCAPTAPADTCSALSASDVPCFSVWSSQPEPCAGCGKPFGTLSWRPRTCSGIPTHMWQFMEQQCTKTCGGKALPNVDLDMTDPDQDLATAMLHLHSRP